MKRDEKYVRHHSFFGSHHRGKVVKRLTFIYSRLVLHDPNLPFDSIEAFFFLQDSDGAN